MRVSGVRRVRVVPLLLLLVPPVLLGALDVVLTVLLIALKSSLNGFIAPITEEFYFRGYLLPRISRFKIWAPVINSVLHSLYHFWMPWQMLGLVLSLLPAAFVVWWKRNIYLGMIIHVVGNTLGSIVRLLMILNLP